MELKTKYQYTYFIYPYVVNEKNYVRYLQKLLTNKDYKIKFFESDKDADLYEYFLPKVRNTIFWSMDFAKMRISKFESLDKNMQATVLGKYPCAIFEYNLKKDIQGKAGKKDGIFFNISKIEIICFNNGICFLSMKTMLEGENTLADVCNFNYKFRDIKSKLYDFKGYENIKIQTDMFEDIKEITALIKEITGNNKGAKELNLDTERFITYSYACIDQEDWNDKTNTELLGKEFYKFANVESADSVVESISNETKNKTAIVEKSKYELYGCSNIATVLLTSDKNSENYTKLPHIFERQYLYNYIFELYKKISLKKVNNEFKQNRKFEVTKQKFIDFTQKVWIEETTNDNTGSALEDEWSSILKLEEVYHQVKAKYDVLYKNSNIEKTAKTNKIIVVILIILLIINIINIFKLF